MKRKNLKIMINADFFLFENLPKSSYLVNAQYIAGTRENVLE